MEAYDQAIKLNPNDASAYLNKGAALKNLGKKNEAMQAYDQAIKLDPNYTHAYYNKGILLTDLGRKEEAMQAYDQVIKLDPNNANAYSNKGMILKDLGKMEEAMQAYNQAIKLNPNFPNAHSNKGILLKDLGKKDEAMQAYNQAIKLNPNFALAYYNKANLLKDLGKVEEAMQVYDQAIKLNPNYANAYLNKGILLKDLGKMEEAMQAYDQTIKLDPNFPNAHINKGILLKDLGKKDEAMQAYNQAIKLNPNFALAYYNKGNLLMDLGKMEEAMQAYDQAIKLNPNFALAYFNKGILLTNLGKNDEAMQAYDQAIKVDPNFPISFCNRSVLYNKAGKYDLALQDLKRAQALVDQGIWGEISQRNKNYIRNTLKGILELESKGNSLEKEALGLDQTNPAVQEFIGRLKDAKNTFNTAAGNALSNMEKKTETDINDAQLQQLNQKFEQMRYEIFELKKEQAELKKDIQDSGAALKAQIKRQFDNYNYNKDYKHYYKVFYWTSINLLGAYQTLDTGLVQANLDSQTSTKEKLIVKGAQQLMKFGTNIPIFGSIFGVLDSIIGAAYDAVKENRLKNKVTAINGVIRNKFNIQEDLHLNIAQVAIAMTEARRNLIDDPPLARVPGKLERGMNWIKEKLHAVKQKVLPELELEDMKSYSASIALEDVVLFFGYLCLNAEQVIKDERPLEVQCTSLVQFNAFYEVIANIQEDLDEKELESPSWKVSQQQKLIAAKPAKKTSHCATF